MEKILNRGLKFAILPLKLDITQILTDFKRFERTMIWKEFWAGRDDSNQPKPPIFKQRKNNLPFKYKSPKGLIEFLASVRSELLDPKCRKNVKCNVSDGEIKALQQLIQLQKEREIVIKMCDKGAGIIILDFSEYIKSCNEHLNSESEENEKYYTRVNATLLQEAYDEILLLLQEGLDNNIISQQDFEAMKPDNLTPSKFYAIFKVHKYHIFGQTPPLRPIVSGCGSMFENIGLFIEHYIKTLGMQHKSYLKDTPDFLRQIETLNNNTILSGDCILFTIDVIGLYTNIPQNEGLQCLSDILMEQVCPEVPGGYITRLMEILLKYNIFEFDSELYQQNIGTAMGSRPAPSYANIFMARKLDNKIRDIIRNYSESDMHLDFMKRYLDDIFSLFIGPSSKLHLILDDLNKLHPTIKFTMKHTSNKLSDCSCEKIESIPFLDTSCSIKEGKIMTDLYKKPTDKNQYLLPSSCHGPQITKNVPFSLALRIIRICSENESRDLRLKELKSMLIEREYTPGIINSAISRAKAIPREKALRQVSHKDTNTRPVFVVPFDPRMPSISDITSKHWRSMVSQDKYLKEIFPAPPLIAYSKQMNIRDRVIRAKVPPPITRPERKIPGMKKCGKYCLVCPFVNEVKQVAGNNFKWNILKSYNCNTSNIVYIISCKKENCRQQYVGEMDRTLKTRILEHIGYIRNYNIKEATGYHFNQSGHSLENMTVTVLEKVRKRDEAYRRERERYHINNFNTFYKGMNRKM